MQITANMILGKSSQTGTSLFCTESTQTKADLISGVKSWDGGYLCGEGGRTPKAHEVNIWVLIMF